MKTVFAGLIIVLLQYSACYPADGPISNMMATMSSFANKSESAMESVTKTSNKTTEKFTSKTSNLLLEAAKELDITKIKSDVEFLSLLFESVFTIIKDAKSEESLLISDLSIIIPSIIEKCIQQLQAAFFKVFFGSLVPSSFTGFVNLANTAVNASTTAADVGLKVATALETGKLNAVSNGIDAAEKVADSITSKVPSNGATDAIKDIVNASLDSAKGAVDAAKALETQGSNALSGVLNSFKFGK